MHSDLPALTDQDYGAVRVRFTPPTSLNDVIPQSELRGTWLQALARRTVAQSARSAVVLLEVRAAGPHVPAVLDDAGQDIGVPLTVMPLAVYRYDSRGGLGFTEVQSFADRVIGPRLLIHPDLLVRARVRVTFSQEDPSSLVSTLAPLVSAAAAFGAQGFLVDAFASQSLVENAQHVESLLRSTNDVDATSDTWADLSFEGGNRLDYSFQLNPRARRDQSPRPQGMLTLTLERRPSLFTRDLLPGAAPGRALPDYGTNGQLNSVAIGRIWSAGPSSIIGRDPELSRLVDVLHNANVPVGEFDDLCRRLRTRLDGFSLSRHDTTAIAWAAFVTGDSAQRGEIQNINCVRRDRELWASYGFALPAAQASAPPPPTRAALDEWLDTAVGVALLRQRTPEGFRAIRRLFGNQVRVNIRPDTLFERGEEPTQPYLDGDSVARALRPLRVGCRFVRSGADTPNLPRLSVLARRPDTSQLLTLTIDYAARSAGGIEIVGLTVEPTPDSDFEALSSTSNADARCLDRENAPPG
ncbi:hypothetical protein [Candidatus Viadribacter manganicus]|nr:hypothetical protein [Candidatus Viadribacter manganicus]